MTQFAVSKIPPEVREALEMYPSRQARLTHPDGTFDKAKRFYLSDEERRDCCGGIRNPTRKWPFSEMLHGRTLLHCANLCRVDPKVAKRFLKTYLAGKAEAEQTFLVSLEPAPVRRGLKVLYADPTRSCLFSRFDSGKWENGMRLASCKAGHEVPARKCTCGIYAAYFFHNLPFPRQQGAIVVVVEALGDVLEHEEGWRAEGARVVAVIDADFPPFPRIDRAQAQEMVQAVPIVDI